MKPQNPWLGGIVLICWLVGCDSSTTQLTYELEGAFRNFTLAVGKRDEASLRASVHLPGVENYHNYVNTVLLKYLDEVQQGKIYFDQQGIVAVRFLHLEHLRHQVEKVKLGSDGSSAAMRISIHFAFDNNIKFAEHEPGTKVFVPAKPFGTAHTIVIGGENPIPREQLKYLEMDINFVKLAQEQPWVVRNCKVDEDSVKFEVSLIGDF